MINHSSRLGSTSVILKTLSSLHSGRSLCYVASPDSCLDTIAKNLEFLQVTHRIHIFDSWDCSYYDRLSPSIKVMQARMQTLCQLTAGDAPCLVLTNEAAMMQKLPPKQHLQDAVLTLSEVKRANLLNYLTSHGFTRQSVAADSGDYAIRGSIIDVAINDVQGVRLDFFGDDVETGRLFDLATQCSIGQSNELLLYPASEVMLNDSNQKLFWHNYLCKFGSQNAPLPTAIREGRKYQGIEHWMPLFWPNLDTIFDYLPQDSMLILQPQMIDNCQAHWRKIEHCHTQRQQHDHNYPLLPPSSLYLDEDQIAAHLANFATLNPAALTPPSALPLYVQAKAQRISVAQALADLLVQRTNIPLLIACRTPGTCQRTAKMLSEQGIPTQMCENWQQAIALPAGSIGLLILVLEESLDLPEATLLSEADVWGTKTTAVNKRSRISKTPISHISLLQPNDYVVHIDHGIGIFAGLESLSVQNITYDFIKIFYANNDRLYLPVENLDLISRYGGDETNVMPDKLGSSAWQRRKAQLKKHLELVAQQLLEVAAARKLQESAVIQPTPELYQQFCSFFQHLETEDQTRAIEETLENLASTTPTDRLICGDVGFGKTEVAMRAAAAAVFAENPVQVIVLAPTTLLARQHYKTFCERFAAFPVRIAQLSKFVTTQQARINKAAISDGSADIIIGTHALLAKDIRFHNLGLIIIDEEQHFGVKQKEQLKALKTNAHIISLSATPIPRTLQMSLTGIKDLSIISTPPINRLPIRTYVTAYDALVIREAILNEHNLGGRIFYITPRIEYIQEVTNKLKALVPEVRIGIAHGKMAARELERVMNQFYEGHFSLLISTNIVESGLDISFANTIIVDRAEKFGIAQLYQMRGRVGRSKLQAYAYFLVSTEQQLSDDKHKRLSILESLNYPASGMLIATHDMETRGYGNLLGEEQSGHIKEVGLELYQTMLQEAMSQSTDCTSIETNLWSPILNLGVAGRIPDEYIGDGALKLSIYTQLCKIKDEEELERFAAELIDRFGPLPDPIEQLLFIIKLKQLARVKNVAKIDCNDQHLLVTFRSGQTPPPAEVMELIAKHGVKPRSDNRLGLAHTWPADISRIKKIHNILLSLPSSSGA